ncbi:MAG: hypothetical protein RL532_885, partial [Actinomycetota bacterium]
FSKGEAGRGQHEINLSYTRALEMADRNTVYKTAAKEIAAGLGRSVTFMAKYDFAETGSSCHVHSSLWHLSEGAMRGSAFDAGHGDGARDSTPSHGTPAMTDHFRMYLAGQLAAARDFFNPARGRRQRWHGASTTAHSAIAWSATVRARALSVAFPALTPTRISRLLARLRRVSMAFAIVCNSMTHIPVTGMKRRICHAFPPHWLRPPTCGNTVRLRANVLATTCTIICSPWRGTNGRVFNKPSPIGSVCATSSAPNP